MGLLITIFNPALDSKEVNFQSCDIDLLRACSDTGGEEEDVLGSSLVVNLNFGLGL